MVCMFVMCVCAGLGKWTFLDFGGWGSGSRDVVFEDVRVQSI